MKTRQSSKWLSVFTIAFAFLPLQSVRTANAEETTDSGASGSVVFTEDFEMGAERWEIFDTDTWELQSHGKGQSLAITDRKSAYEPKVRSPRHIALIKDLKLSSFEMTFAVKSTKDTGNHRDCCVFFNYQAPSNFYYVHLGAKPDPHSGQIFIVNNAPRTAITKNQKRVPWTDGWHHVKVIRDAESGRIAVYFDDMDTPLLEGNDTTFGEGRIGIGSFDDMDAFDEIELRVKS